MPQNHQSDEGGKSHGQGCGCAGKCRECTCRIPEEKGEPSGKTRTS